MINILDAVIILLIFGSGFLGLKRGAIKSTISFVGIIVVVVFSYFLKNPVADFMITNLPFFSLGSLFKGISILNILIYEAIAFIIVFSILQIILKLTIKLSGILESILSATIILGIPSKILGFFLGLLEGYIYAFIIVFVLSLCSFSFELTHDSKLNSIVLEKTPILTTFAKDTYNSVNEIYELKDKYKTLQNAEEYNYEATEILLKYKVINTNTLTTLIEKDKIKLNNSNYLIEKYKEK